MKPIAKILLWVLPLALYGLFLASPINLVTADLGRHLKNGEILLDLSQVLSLRDISRRETSSTIQDPSSKFQVLSTNFYSYTYPDYPTTNHHWLSGVIFYAVWKFFGFVGLQLFFIALSLATLLIFFTLAKKRAGLGWASLLTIPVIPLLLERDEIRPEVFSYLFSGIFFWLMLKYRDGEIGWKKLLILPALQILWVNLHIYFFLGPVIIGVFLLEHLIFRVKEKEALKRLIIILALTLLATLINPYGLDGAIAPLSIFKNFGYSLAENKPVWFIEKILSNPNFLVFKIVFALLIASFFVRLARDKHSLSLTDTLLALGFSAAGWLAIRNFAVFGLFALPIAAGNFARGFNLKQQTDRRLGNITITTLILAVLITFSGELWKIYPQPLKLGLGLENGNENSMTFFKENQLTGPIFNNYDIGGYLIWHLYPQEKVYPEQFVPSGIEGSRRVFVDNRPEAYPAEFFEKIYIPMQENKNIWAEKSALYKFNAIIFSYRDYTPWGQTFFARILEDPEWKTVFADSRVVILLKNNELNKDTIAKYGKSISIKHQRTN
ncbi:MAG: hypothetical protein HY454_01925 [Parcubacteria group bacterium]|nr:hypothetical protein [Parcubacteria group bacterium]